MDYHGTDENDDIDQVKLKILDWTNIYSGKGDDHITFGSANVLGEEGNDTLIGVNSNSGVVYWTSTSGINANLATGTVVDGLGGTDTLVNIHNLQGSRFDDIIIGSTTDDNFFGGGGSNTITGGGGVDSVIFYNIKSSDVQISYDKATDVFTVHRNLSGDIGTDILTSISKLVFAGPQSDFVTITREDFTPGNINVSKYFTKNNDSSITAPVSQLNTSISSTVIDANHDGIPDILLYGVYAPYNGNQPVAQPGIFMIGHGDGSYTPSTTLISPTFSTIHPRETVQADFNEDGFPDLFVANHGYDAMPFPGEKNTLLLSVKIGGFVNASVNLPDISDFTHSATTGDVNGDGHQDIFVGNYMGSPYFLMGDGKGGFAKTTAGLATGLQLLDHLVGHTLTFTSCLLVDLNGDHFPELVLGSDGSDGRVNTDLESHSAVFWNKSGSYNSTDMSLLPYGYFGDVGIVHDILAWDIDGDGDQDLFMLGSDGLPKAQIANGWSLEVLRNDNGVFVDDTATHFSAANTHEGLPGIDSHIGVGLFIRTMDINSDGALDLVMTSISNAPPSDVTPLAWMNDGYGHFSVALHAADFAFGVEPIATANGVNFVAIAEQNGLMHIQEAIARKLLPLPTNITATSHDDIIKLNSNNNVADGAAGVDSVLMTGKLSEYTIHRTGSSVIVHDKLDRDGTDTLSNVEAIRFLDKTLNLTIQATASTVALNDLHRLEELYVAFFNRIPDADGLSYWVSQFKAGSSINQIAESFYGAGIANPTLTGFSSSMTNADFVNVIYKNVLGRANGADAEGLAYWAAKLDDHSATHGSLVATILNSAHSFKGDVVYGYVADLLDNKIIVANNVAVDLGVNFNTDQDSIIQGMLIAAAVTATSTAAALNLVGINFADINLL